MTHATGGVAVALDALMRERRGCGSRTAAAPPIAASSTRATRSRSRPTRRRISCGGSGSRADVHGLLRRLRQRGAVAAVPSRRRAAAVPQRELGGVSGRQRAASRRRSTTNCDSDETPVFIQDYHLALVAQRLRERRPAARTALFWHIPWPYPDRLRICPWRRELLEGLLANDLIAFQLERDRRNFAMAVEEELDADIDAGRRRRFVSDRATTVVTAVPIGVDYDRIQMVGARHAPRRRAGAAARPTSACRRRSSASASIASTTRRAFRSASKRSTCCSRDVPTCAAASPSCRSACRHGRSSAATARSSRKSIARSPS